MLIVNNTLEDLFQRRAAEVEAFLVTASRKSADLLRAQMEVAAAETELSYLFAVREVTVPPGFEGVRNPAWLGKERFEELESKYLRRTILTGVDLEAFQDAHNDAT